MATQHSPAALIVLGDKSGTDWWTTPSTSTALRRPEDTASPLLALPPELRNIIYGYVVAEGRVIDIRYKGEPPLTRCCKDIRAECLQMYYARNVFGFSPLSREDDALEELELWLSRIGEQNCKALRRLAISLNRETGLLINEREETADPWASLFTQIGAAGCTGHLCVDLNLDKDVQPNPKRMKEGILALGSEEAVNGFVEDKRLEMEWAILSYCEVLRRRTFVPAEFDAFEERLSEPGEASSSGDFVQLIKAFVYVSDRTWYWNGGVDVGPRDDFPYDKLFDCLPQCMDELAVPQGSAYYQWWGMLFELVGLL